MRIGKRRLLLAAGSITAVGAIGTLVMGVTFGFFSSTPASETNTFTAGTVTLSSDVSGACVVGNNANSNIAAGDSGSCTFKASYSGSLPAYMALDISIAPGATALYDSSANGLQLSITDNQGSPVTYMNGTSLNGGATAGTSPNAKDLLVSKSAFSNGASVIWTVNWSLPASAGNPYEGGSSVVTLTAHAVQSANNGSTSGCTAGLQCDSASPGAGSPAWS